MASKSLDFQFPELPEGDLPHYFMLNVLKTKRKQVDESLPRRYAPTSCFKSESYASYLDKLGFKPADDSGEMRTALIQDLRLFTTDPERMYLREIFNKPAFKRLVLEFLQLYGSKYWGDSKRDHLEEMDVIQGFLYPRDIYRNKSRLLEVMFELFNYKAHTAVRNDMQRPIERQIASRIDFSNLEHPKGAIRVTEEEKGQADAEASTSIHQKASNRNNEYSNEPVAKRVKRRNARAIGSIIPQLVQLPLGNGSIEIPSLSGPSGLMASSRVKTATRHQKSTPRPPEPTQRFLLAGDRPNLPTPLESPEAPDIHNIDSDEEKNIIVKPEPLADDILSSTYFMVTATNQPSTAPITVAFSSCKTFASFFPTMIQECSVLKVSAKKVVHISATFTWSGRRLCLRKDKETDWTMFCTILRNAWDKNASRFDDGCEVELLLHVDD